MRLYVTTSLLQFVNLQIEYIKYNTLVPADILSWKKYLLIFTVTFNNFSFDLYFRKNPFGGEFTIFGGLEECIRFIANFKLTDTEITFLRSAMPTCEVGIPNL